MYRQQNKPERFQEYFDETLKKFSTSNKSIFVMGDFNINLLDVETCNYAHNFLLSSQSFSLRGFHTAWQISHRSKMILDLIYGHSKPLEKASYYTKSKGRKEESIGGVFKKPILVKSSYTWNNSFEITFMFSAHGLLVVNGTSVTCLRKSREPITALNVATYVTPLMVRNFWLW